MNTTGIGTSGVGKFLSSHPVVDEQTIPKTASPQGSVYMGDWIYRLERSAGMEGTMLGKMVRDMESTFRVVGSALQVSGKASMEKIKQEQGIFALSAVVAALLGNVLYGTSLLTLTAIKTVIWVPMIAFSAVLGGVGAILLHTCEAVDQRTLAKGALEFFGYAAAGVGEIMGFVAFIPSAVLLGMGCFGAIFTESNKEVATKLLSALLQADTSHIPVAKSFIPGNLQQANENELAQFFQWIDELGVDFNETKFFNNTQTPLLCIKEDYAENGVSTIWNHDRLTVIKESLIKAKVWDKLLPETRTQIEEYMSQSRSTSS